MKFFYWNRNFEVGIGEIDHQHRQLVDLINALAALIADGGRLPDVQSLFSELMDYAAVHFSDEERLFDSSGLADEEKALHRRAHRGFVEKAEQILSSSRLERAETAERVLEFLTAWLVSHILRLDMKIAHAGEPAADAAADQYLFDVSPVERVLIGALAETERRFRLISDHTPALIWVSDSTGRRGFFNRALTDFIGLDDGAALDDRWSDFIHPDDRQTYRALLDGLVRHPEPAEAEYRLRKYDGTYCWLLEKILPRVDSTGVFMGLIASATDISVIKQAENLLIQSNKELEQEVARRTAQLEQLMLTDPLTGIGNRRFLASRLDEEALRAHRYNRPFTVVFFDVDHFKRINDRYGHATGDAVLARVAQCLKGGLRDCDLIGRFGGEEFVVVLVETALEPALAIAERLRTAIGGIRCAEMAETVTASAGLAEWRRGDTGSTLLQRSDRALYAAKAGGRDCCRVDRQPLRVGRA